MSLNSLQPLKTKALYEPKIDFESDESDHDYAVLKGPSNIQIYTLNPQGNAKSDSGETSWQLYMPSRSTVLDKTILLNGEMTFYLSEGVAPATHDDARYLLKQQGFAPQAFPLNHCIQTITLDIDGNLWSANIGSFYPILKYLSYTEDDLIKYNSMTPTLLDNTTVFRLATNNSVLNGEDDNNYNQIQSRGSYKIKSIYQPTPADNVLQKASITYSFTEPLQLSPLCLTNNPSADDEPGFIGLSNMKIKITWYDSKTMFDRAFKVNPIPNVANTTGFLQSGGSELSPSTNYIEPSYTKYIDQEGLVATGTAIIDKLSLTVGTYSLSQIVIPEPIQTYEFSNIQYVPQVLTKLDPADDKGPKSNERILNNIQLSGIPNKLVVAIVPTGNLNVRDNAVAVSLRPFERGDCFFPIYKIGNITFANRSGLLTNQSPWTLYKNSINNGLNFISYSNSGMGGEYIPTGTLATQNPKVRIPMGCPLVLSFGSCFGIPIDDPTLAPGVAVNLNFQMTVSCYNYYQSTIDVTAYMIFIYDGVFTLSNSAGSSFSFLILSRQDVLDADENGSMSYSQLRGSVQYTGQGLAGGSFFGKLKRFGRNSVKFLKNPKVQNIIRQALSVGSDLGIPGASQASHLADIGTNLLNKQGSGAYVAGRLISSREAGGSMVAGASMSASQLRSRLRS